MLGLGLRDRFSSSRFGGKTRRLFRWSVSPEFRSIARTADEILATIPRAKFEAIQSRYMADDPSAKGARIVHASSRKYLDARHWIENAVERAVAVDLDTRPPLSVLDLGCGSGWFLYVARHFGHRPMGLDLGDNRMYNELVELLSLDRAVHCIDPFVPLPDFGREFDLITGYMVYFNFFNFGKGDARAWGPKEWHFFLDDVRKVLVPGGHLRLELNRGGFYLPPNERGVYLTDETATELCSIRGVSVSATRSVVTLDN